MGAQGSAAGAPGAGEDAATAAKAAADAAAAQAAVAAAEAAAKAKAAQGRPKAPRQPAPPPAKPVTFSETGKNFMKRVEQVAGKKAEADVMAALGCTLAEAKARLASAAAGNTAAAGPAATAANDAEVKKIKTEKDRLERENANLKNQVQANRGKDKARIQELEDTLEQRRVMDIARDTGFSDPGYAMYKFAEASAASDEKLDEAAFFADLKAKNPHLGVATTPATGTPEPRRVPATAAPAPSTAPGGALPSTTTPAPAAAGTGSGEKTVDQMTTQEFADHTERTFGYRPGR